MRNRKRELNGYKVQLGRYKLTRKNIMVFEKILWEYADAHEMKYAKVTKLPEGRKHMPRKFADRHIIVGQYNVDSVKFLPKEIRLTHSLEVACKPGITVRFTPFTTIINAQTNYATGIELKVMKETVRKLESYIVALPRSFINTCVLSK